MVPVLNNTTGVEQDVQFPFLLTHEFIQHLVDKMGDRIDVFLHDKHHWPAYGSCSGGVVCTLVCRQKHGGAYWALW